MTDNAKQVTKTQVAIVEETIRGSEVTLADGTMLGIKPTIIGVRRMEGQYTESGDPLYEVNHSMVVTIIACDPKRRGRAKT